MAVANPPLPMRALLHLLGTQPHLLGDHAQAYAELVGREFGDVSSAWKRRAMLHAVALCSLGVAAVLGGVALMLWGTWPASQIQAPWVLLAAPLLPALLAVACLLSARSVGSFGAAMGKLQQQIQADLAMLREAHVP